MCCERVSAWNPKPEWSAYLCIRLISREGHREQANAEDSFHLPNLELSSTGSDANISHSVHGPRDSKVGCKHSVVRHSLKFKTGYQELWCITERIMVVNLPAVIDSLYSRRTLSRSSHRVISFRPFKALELALGIPGQVLSSSQSTSHCQPAVAWLSETCIQTLDSNGHSKYGTSPDNQVNKDETSRRDQQMNAEDEGRS